MLARDVKHIDISDSPELLRLVEEVRASNEPRVLQYDNEDVAILRPLKRPAQQRASRGLPTSADDPLWKLVGVGASQGPDDVSIHKHQYLADAYADRHG